MFLNLPRRDFVTAASLALIGNPQPFAASLLRKFSGRLKRVHLKDKSKPGSTLCANDRSDTCFSRMSVEGLAFKWSIAQRGFDPCGSAVDWAIL